MIRRISVLAAICAAMIAVHIVDLLLGGSLEPFGVHPRDLGSIYTIFTAPFLHENFAHLGGNLVLFLIFGSLCIANGVRFFLKASLLIIVVGGLLVWLFGRDANHIGASGWIFGLWSLTLTLALFDRSLLNIAISAIVLFYFGGMAAGVLPTDAHISFEGHFFGAVAGVAAAFVLSGQRTRLARPKQAKGELKFWS
jgi:membrane associated rhomboid family serine protease